MAKQSWQLLQEIKNSESRILELEKAARDIENSILKKKQNMQPLIEKAKKHEEQILKLQQDILEKAKQKTESIKSKVEEGTRVVANFEKFFERKAEVETFIVQIEREKKELEDSFKLLEKKAIAFDLATKSNSMSVYIKDLEKDLENVNKKKDNFKENLEKLIKLVKG